MISVSTWSAWRRIIAPAPKQVVTVTGTDTDGTVYAETMGGNIWRGKGEGSYNVGDKVIVRGTEILGKANDNPVTIVTV